MQTKKHKEMGKKMNKLGTSEQAKQELQETGEITMLEERNEEREYDKILLKSKTKDEMIKKMQEAEYSEFTIGMIIGHLLALETKMKKRSWIPSIMRKW